MLFLIRQLKTGRTSVAMVGYTNIITSETQVQNCATTGIHVLLENDKIAVTGTMLYDRSEGILLPYLAAVIISTTHLIHLSCTLFSNIITY